MILYSTDIASIMVNKPSMLSHVLLLALAIIDDNRLRTWVNCPFHGSAGCFFLTVFRTLAQAIATTHYESSLLPALASRLIVHVLSYV